MSWEDQGRQEHGWFGNGTAPPKDKGAGAGAGADRNGVKAFKNAEAAAARVHVWAKAYGPLLFGLPRSGAVLAEFADAVRRIERDRPGSIAWSLDGAAQRASGVHAAAMRDGLRALVGDGVDYRPPDDSPPVQLVAGETPEDDEIRRVAPTHEALSDAEVLRQDRTRAAYFEIREFDPDNRKLIEPSLKPPGYVPSEAEVEDIENEAKMVREGKRTPPVTSPVAREIPAGREPRAILPPEQLPPFRWVTTDRPMGPGAIIGDIRALEPSEVIFVQRLAAAGNVVKLIPRSIGRTPDFEISGTKYEYKYLSNSPGTDADSLSKAVLNTIQKADGQSGNIIIDAESQPGMTSVIARRGIVRAYVADNDFGMRIQNVTVFAPDGIVNIPRIPQ